MIAKKQIYFHVNISKQYLLLLFVVLFLVIACKPTFPPYLNALLPQDQIFDPEDLEYNHKQTEEGTPRKRIKSERKSTEVKMETEESTEATDLTLKQEDTTSPNWDIDNPYLAATKLPSKND